MNQDLDINTINAAIKASPFIVSLVSFSGGVMLSQGCGTIIEASENDNIVMTSLNLIRQRPTDAEARFVENSLATDVKCGDGGPLVNLSGEVVGLVYYEIGPIIPFLPINIVQKWWDHYKKYKELRHPSYGFDARNLYSASLFIIDKLTRRFPNISDGVWIEKVHTGSYAESAGLRVGDIVTTCDGKPVKSFLELWGCMWDKVGDTVELEVARVRLKTIENIRMAVGEAMPDELNKWPHFNYW